MDEIRGDHRSVPSEEGISRRTVAGRALAGGIAAALLATTGRHDARAQATPEADNTGPIRYVLQGGETAIVYVPAVGGSAAQLEYRDAKGTLSFAGDELSVEQSPALAGLVSASIEYAPDGYERIVTLLVPDVNRDEIQPDVPIHTIAILTMHLTSIGGPALVKGALQTYEVVELDGVAEFAPV